MRSDNIKEIQKDIYEEESIFFKKGKNQTILKNSVDKKRSSLRKRHRLFIQYTKRVKKTITLLNVTN